LSKNKNELTLLIPYPSNNKETVYKRNTKSSSNPFNAKISFEAYLHIPVSKAVEGNYESYNLQGVY
jgi:hypothetical protein